MPTTTTDHHAESSKISSSWLPASPPCAHSSAVPGNAVPARASPTLQIPTPSPAYRWVGVLPDTARSARRQILRWTILMDMMIRRVMSHSRVLYARWRCRWTGGCIRRARREIGERTLYQKRLWILRGEKVERHMGWRDDLQPYRHSKGQPLRNLQHPTPCLLDRARHCFAFAKSLHVETQHRVHSNELNLSHRLPTYRAIKLKRHNLLRFHQCGSHYTGPQRKWRRDPSRTD